MDFRSQSATADSGDWLCLRSSPAPFITNAHYARVLSATLLPAGGAESGIVTSGEK